MLNDFAMTDGQLNPDAMLEQMALNCCIYAGDKQAATDILSLSGGGEIVDGEYQPQAWSPSWAVAAQNGHVYIVFCGTVNWKQWGGHILGGFACAYPENGDGGPIILSTQAVHSFWYGIWLNLRPKIRKAIANNPFPVKIHITGHSYGGAIAELCANHLAVIYGEDKVEVMTFGEPMSQTSNYDRPRPDVAFWVSNGEDPIVNARPITVFSVLPGSRFLLQKLLAKKVFHFGHLGKHWCLIPTGGLFKSDDDVGPPALALAFNESEPKDHLPEAYMQSCIRLVQNRGIISPSAVIARVGLQTIRFGFPNADKPATAFNPPGLIPLMNQLYYPRQGEYLTDANLDSMESVGLQIENVDVRLKANIFVPDQTTFTGGDAMLSGYFKIELFTNNGKYGSGTSVIWKKVGGDLNDAINKGKAIASARARLLGSPQTAATTYPKAINRPVIEYMRVSDALNPREGQLVTLGGDDYGGRLQNSVPLDADVMSTALGFRIRGVNEQASHRVAYSNHQIVGQPDTNILGGVIQWGNVMSASAPQTFGQCFQAYIDTLISPANDCGFLGQADSAAKKDIDLFTKDTNLLWLCHCQGHGYVTNDRVRITQCRVKGFSKVHLVKYKDADNFWLQGPLSFDRDTPAAAKVQKVQNANGTKPLDFYPYQLDLLKVLSSNTVKITKKNLAREFNPVSFRRRGRR